MIQFKIYVCRILLNVDETSLRYRDGDMGGRGGTLGGVLIWSSIRAPLAPCSGRSMPRCTCGYCRAVHAGYEGYLVLGMILIRCVLSVLYLDDDCSRLDDYNSSSDTVRGAVGCALTTVSFCWCRFLCVSLGMFASPCCRCRHADLGLRRDGHGPRQPGLPLVRGLWGRRGGDGGRP